MKNALAVFALLCASLVASLLLGEVLIRITAPQQLVSSRPDIWIPDQSGLGHRHAPAVDTLVNTGEREVRFRTDRNGYRTSDEGIGVREATGDRVLVLGDSFIEALSIAYPDTVTARLEDLASAGSTRSVTLVNTAVSGYSPTHYAIVAGRELAQRRYDAVIMFVYVMNDIVTSRETRYSARPFELEHEIEWPSEFSMRSVMTGLVHPIYTKLRTMSHLVVFVKRSAMSILVRAGLTSSGAFPGALRRELADIEAWEITADTVDRAAASARSRGTPFLVVLIPADYQVDEDLGRKYAEAHGVGPLAYDLEQPNRRLQEELESRGVTVIDTLPALRAAREAGVALYGRVDRHTSPAGHRILAEVVGPPLLEALAR